MNDTTETLIRKTLTNARFWFAAWKKDGDIYLAARIKQCVTSLVDMLQRLCMVGWSAAERKDINKITEEVSMIEAAMA
jgi:hypothetical protein